jgi:hypothetical protein
MTNSLRPLRIRLVDPTRVADLLAYLRDRGCIAEQVDPVAVDVWPGPLLHDGTRDGLCAACGEEVEAALRRLGSPRCHDCRIEAPNAVGTPANGDARRRCRQALTELQEHLRAWRSVDGSAVAVLDD